MRDWKAEVRARLRDLDIDPARHAQIVDELGDHLADRHRTLINAGMSDEAADRAVVQELSDSDVMSRDIHRVVSAPPPDRLPDGPASRRWLDGIWQDVRYGARMLRRSPGFTAVAVLTLALGVGANTAIFAVVNGIVLRPLPYAQPDRLVRVWESNPEKGWPTFSASHPNFLDWRAQSRSFERLAAQASAGFTLTSASGEADIVRGAAVTADFLPALGIEPAIGRNFRSDEDRPGGHTRVAIITHGFWQRRLGSNPSALGTSLTLDGVSYEIIGILAETFSWGGPTLDLLVPLAPDPARGRGDHRLLVIGRLAAGVSLAQASSEMNGIAAQLARQYPASNGGWSVRLRTFYDWIVPQETRQSLLILSGAVALVLLIACGNVASLMLARGAVRQKEISVRIALGAERSRIVRQLLVESMLLALMATALGLAAAAISTRALIAAGPAAGLPRLAELSIDARVFGFALGIALASALLFGMLPAIHASRSQVSDTLKESGRGATGSRARQRVRNALVIGEVALSVALLIGAGLLIRSFWLVQRVHPGFQTERVMTLRINLPRTSYGDGAKARAFYERLLPELSALPGVQAVATSSGVPLTAGNTGTELKIPGRTLPADVPASADWRLVSPGYFKALNIPLRGRDFDNRDVPARPDAEPPAVVIISEAMAHRYWPGEDPIGKTVVITSFGAKTQTIIGVAGDVRSFGLDVEAGPMVYASAIAYSGWNPMSLVVRSVIDPLTQVAEVRTAIRQIDANVPAYELRVLDDLLSESLGPRRFFMLLVGSFAAVALTLASIGLFGVLAYLVSQRTRDIGIRLALGAGRGDVMKLVVGQGMILAMTGAVLGLAAAFAGARVLQTLLFTVAPRDPLTFVSVPLLLLAVAFLACYVPARRAVRIDPLVALRAE